MKSAAFTIQNHFNQAAVFWWWDYGPHIIQKTANDIAMNISRSESKANDIAMNISRSETKAHDILMNIFLPQSTSNDILMQIRNAETVTD